MNQLSSDFSTKTSLLISIGAVIAVLLSVLLYYFLQQSNDKEIQQMIEPNAPIEIEQAVQLESNSEVKQSPDLNLSKRQDRQVEERKIRAPVKYEDIMAVREHELARQARSNQSTSPPSTPTDNVLSEARYQQEDIVTSERQSPASESSEKAVSEQEKISTADTVQATSEVTTAIASEADTVPLLLDTEVSFQQNLPELKLDVHVYSARSDERFVLINMKKYREGDKTREGARVDTIVQNGVIIDYQGTRFRLVSNH